MVIRLKSKGLGIREHAFCQAYLRYLGSCPDPGPGPGQGHPDPPSDPVGARCS